MKVNIIHATPRKLDNISSCIYDECTETLNLFNKCAILHAVVRGSSRWVTKRNRRTDDCDMTQKGMKLLGKEINLNMSTDTIMNQKASVAMILFCKKLDKEIINESKGSSRCT